MNTMKSKRLKSGRFSSVVFRKRQPGIGHVKTNVSLCSIKSL